MSLPSSSIAAVLGAIAAGSPDLRIESHTVGFTLAAQAFLRKMKVAAHVDHLVEDARATTAAEHATGGRGWFKPTGPSVGTCVEAMVLNVLDGRMPLYRIGDWLSHLPVTSMWGAEASAESFDDSRLARALDSLWELGLDEVFAPLVVDWKQSWNLSFANLHSDGSSIPLQGTYDVEESAPGPHPARGFSKDNDRRNVQLVIGMTVQCDGIPLRLSMHEGNASDTLLFRSHIEHLGNALSDVTERLFVGDSKLCDTETLGGLRDQEFHALTLMPRTFALREQLISEALAHEAWVELHRQPGRTKRDPGCLYEGKELTFDMPLSSSLADGKKRQWSERWSALVVRSSELAKGHHEHDEKAWAKEGEAWEAKAKALIAVDHAERADAEAVLEEVLDRKAIQANGWLVSGDIEVRREPLPRKQPGRPRKGEVQPTVVTYRVVLRVRVDEQQRAAARRRQGLFVLVSSRRWGEDWTQSLMLLTYREKNAVEEGFHWMKAPSQVAPVFLHTPHRIAALGLVFVIALALHRLLQREVRRALADRKEVVPGHNKTVTSTPTTLVLQRAFEHVKLLCVHAVEGTAQVMQGVTDVHRRILSLLGLPPDLYDVRNSALVAEP
jgi:transposase